MSDTTRSEETDTETPTTSPSLPTTDDQSTPTAASSDEAASSNSDESADAEVEASEDETGAPAEAPTSEDNSTETAEEAAEAEPEEDPLPETFAELGVPENILSALDKMGWTKPTPVQCKAYDPLVGGDDLLVQSHTGSGKTGAFCLPWLAKFEPGDPKETGVQLIVVLPTRELAKQVCVELERLAGDTEVKVLPVYGGTAMVPQLEDLKRGVHAVVGTPGRILDHIRRRSLDLSKVKLAVLDECDEMLSMGFLEDIRSILQACPKERQTCLFSATVPRDIARIAERYMREPKWITLSTDHISAAEIEHAYYVSDSPVKTRDLLDMIMVEQPGFSIVFCNTREETRFVAGVLRREGFDAEDLSSDLTQAKRERVLQRMRDHKLHFLVATDIAARGIDISHVSHVINYSFPEQAENYVHRTGRTGRAGRAGLAISLIGASEIGNFHLLKKIYKSLTFNERKFPPKDELQAQRTETKVDSISQRLSQPVSPEWTLLARQLVKDPRGEAILAYLLSEEATPEKLRARSHEGEPESSEAEEPRYRDRGERDGRRDRDRGRRRGRGRDRDERGEDRRGRRGRRRRDEDVVVPPAEGKGEDEEVEKVEESKAPAEAETETQDAPAAEPETEGAEGEASEADEGEGKRKRRRRRRRRRKGGEDASTDETEASPEGDSDAAAESEDDPEADSEASSEDGVQADADGEGEAPKKKRRRRRRRRKKGGETPGDEAQAEGEDTGDSDADDADEAVQADEEGEDGAPKKKRRRRRRRRKKGAGAEDNGEVAPEVLAGGEQPKEALTQSEIVIDIDETELEVVREQFGDVDEFSDLTLTGRRRDVMDELRAEMVIEDVSSEDEEEIEEDVEDGAEDDEAETSDESPAPEGDQGEADSSTPDAGEETITADPESTEANLEAPKKKRRRRRRRKKKEPPPPPPELTAPPHKDFWEVWSQKFSISDFGLAAAADDAAIEEEDRKNEEAAALALEADAGDDEFVRVRLNVGRKHGQKSADIRSILKDRAGLSGRTVRDLTVRTASTLFRVSHSRVEMLQDGVRGYEVAETLLEVTLAEESESVLRVDAPADSDAPAEGAGETEAAAETPAEGVEAQPAAEAHEEEEGDAPAPPSEAATGEEE